MSSENGNEAESARGSIPVCTLFNDGSAQGDNAPASKEDVNPYQSLSEERKENPREPKLCNVFATGESSNSGRDDIFSKISDDASDIEINSQVSENASSTDVSMYPMETLRLNKSVDSFIVEDLTDTDVITDSAYQKHYGSEEHEAEEFQTDYQNLSDASVPSTIMERHSTDDSSTNESHHEPVIASPSFVSVTSFSVANDEQSTISANSSADETGAMTSKIEGLTIEDVRKEDFKHDLPPSPVVKENAAALPAQLEKQEEPHPTVSARVSSASGSTESSSSSSSSSSQDAKQNKHNLPSPNAKKPVEASNIKPEEKEQSSPKKSTQGSSGKTTTKSLFPSQDIQKNSFFPPSKSANVMEDDPFAAALNNSALERRRDAWIPSQATREILMTCIAEKRPPKLQPQKLTRPGLSTSEILEDPVKELVARLTGSDNVVKRKNLTLENVSQDKSGILRLMASGNHRSAANLCAKLLSTHGQGFGQATRTSTNTPETFWLWYTRIYVLIKLNLNEKAATELSAFGNLDNPDMFYEFYPNIYPGRRGSMVPFEFRVMHAEFPRNVGKHNKSLERLQKILSVCEKILKNLRDGKNEVGEPTVMSPSENEASIKFWTGRQVGILFCIGNTLVQMRNHAIAATTFDRILGISPERAVELHSGIGRLFLNAGDMRSAQERFTSAEKAAGSSSQHKVQLLINRGFMLIGTNSWKDAFTQFDSVLNLEPNNITALNNKAVCLLYVGQLKDAISILEEGAARLGGGDSSTTVHNVNANQVAMQQLLMNLSTLYELESSRFIVKKRALFLKHIAPTCGDSFDTTCLKEI